MGKERNWERPPSVPVPTVWVSFESKRKMANGKAPRFRIQDYTEEWKDSVIDCMGRYFVRDEPLCKALKMIDDEEAVEEFKALVLSFLERKMGLIAVVDNLDELGDKSLPVLAGCNITGVVTLEEGHKKWGSEKIRKIFDAINILESKKNCFEHYQVSEFMYALGLSVNPAYRGHGLGEEILKARFPLCKATGVKATVTVFTAAAAQRSAEKAGFETLAELLFSEHKDEHGQLIFNIDAPKSMKLMGFRNPKPVEMADNLKSFKTFPQVSISKMASANIVQYFLLSYNKYMDFIQRNNWRKFINKIPCFS